MTSLTDIAVSDDGSKLYLVTNDGTDVSLWRNASSWERVLTLTPTNVTQVVRPVPGDFDKVFLAEQGGTAMYYSSDAGETSWTLRYTTATIQDLAVESKDVLYVAVQSAATVIKSGNGGFIWGTATSTKLSGGNCHMIKSLGTDLLIVGSTTGYVSYSKDGSSTWTNITSQIESGALLTQVTASGLDTDDYIYAASSESGGGVNRWKIGTSTSWSDIISGTLTGSCYGLELVDGILYALTTDATPDGYLYRDLSPSSSGSTTTWSSVSSAGEQFNASPQGLRVSTGSVKLWAIDNAADKVFSFTDTASTVGPTLTGPADGAEIPINFETGLAQDVIFTWDRLSVASDYDLYIAFDSGFTQMLTTTTVASTSSTVVKVLGPYQGSIFYHPETTYYWKVRERAVSGGTWYSPWSATRSFTTLSEVPPEQWISPYTGEHFDSEEDLLEHIAEWEAAHAPAPEVWVSPYTGQKFDSEAELLAHIAEWEAAHAPVEPTTPAYIWVIIAIGGVLVIAVIVLIVRTRRPV
jgi:hypothetical protein